jgi:hypothetical protein
MHRLTYALLVSIVILAVATVTVVQTLPPRPLPADAPTTEFSAQRAIEHIQVIATEPRPIGSPAFLEARDYVLTILMDLGLEIESQSIPEYGVENVVARIVGSSSSDAVLLVAHLDSVHDSPGASDDGTGVATLLETARALTAGPSLRNTVMFLFTGPEEQCCIGAEAFMRAHPWVGDVRVIVNFDAGGLRGPAVLSAISPDDGWLIRQLVRADRYLVGSSAVTALSDSRTDFGLGFRPAGFSGYGFDLYWDRRIHSPDDTIENLNPPSIQHQGYHGLALARHLGDLDRLEDLREPDRVYFNVLRLFTVSYSRVWAIPLAVVVAGLFVAVVVYGRRRRALSWPGMVYGAVVLLVGLIVATLPAVLLGGLFSGMVPEYTSGTQLQTVQVSLFVALALGLTMAWYALSRRLKSVTLPDLTIGALVFGLVGMVGTAVIFPALSFGFTWPLLFSLLASWGLFRSPEQEPISGKALAGLLIAGAASVVVLGPSILLGLFDQITLSLVFLGILFGFLHPLMHVVMGYPGKPEGH